MTIRTDDPAAIFKRHGDVAVITLNRPHALNAVNADLCAAVGEALEELQSDPALRVGVVTGAGSAFSAGADLKSSPGEARSRRRTIRSGGLRAWWRTGTTNRSSPR